jgi:cytochrome b subunit of formate dehydrogenase
MFRTISIILFAFTLCVVFLSSIVFPCGESWRHPIKKLVHLFTLLFIERKLSFTGVVRKLVYLLALLCFVVLGFTGFYPTLVLNEHISGYLLIVHATFAPILAICLAILVVMWAGKCRFTWSDWPWFQKFIECVTLIKCSEQPQNQNRNIYQKITFWLIIILALPLILSIVLSMFPYFGTDWQELLLAIHRWTAVVFAIVVVVHTYLMIRIQMKR